MSSLSVFWLSRSYAGQSSIKYVGRESSVLSEACQNHLLGLVVKCTGGFIEEENRRLFQQSLCNSNALLLAARELRPSRTDIGVQPLGQCLATRHAAVLLIFKAHRTRRFRGRMVIATIRTLYMGLGFITCKLCAVLQSSESFGLSQGFVGAQGGEKSLNKLTSQIVDQSGTFLTTLP
eukprot:4339809-Amphidinium_carterae.1